jgi:uncharacterized protein YkwD
MKKFLVVLAVAVSSVGFSQGYGDSLVTYDFHSDNTIERYIFQYLNEERIKAGLPAFVIDTVLQPLAKDHSAWMSKTSIYAHSSDTQYPNYKQKKILNYAENCMMYHNIQYESHKDLAKSCVGAWMGSVAHRNNILDPSNTTIGVGFDQKRNDVYPINQMEQYFTIMLK